MIDVLDSNSKICALWSKAGSKNRRDIVKVAFHTLGCKVNFYETDKMTEKFKQNGFDIVSFHDEADVYIINTCSVTNMADRKSRQMIHRAKKMNPKALCVAVGCYVQAAGEELLNDNSIDLIVNNEHKDEVLHLVMDKLGCDEEEQVVDTHIHQSERTRAYIKIQDGCNQFCSYCLIPYVRGRLKSREIDDIVNEVKGLADNGYQEVVLTGIHLSSYGVDKSECKSFLELEGRPLLELLEQVSSIKGIERIRLGSLEPRIITEEFLDKLIGIPKVCPHFHLSLQSGSDSVLERMNRKYTTKEYEEKCKLIRLAYENPAITTDIITGFPGESRREWNETMKFAEKIAFSDIHVFKYSPRAGTKAAQRDDQVADLQKTARSEELISLAHQMSKNYRELFVNKPQWVLLEDSCQINGVTYGVGHNERYVKFGLELMPDQIEQYLNHFVQIMPEKQPLDMEDSGILFGKLVKMG